MNKLVHIVCPGIPSPLSKEDMADTWFQLVYLHGAGYQVLLHCFADNQDADIKAIEKITSHVYLYERNEGHKGLSIKYPYCISSRSNPLLLQNLLLHQCPVIFQGMSSTFFLPELKLHGYETVVRLNGLKSELYEASTKCEKSFFKKAYSFNESRLIKKWEEKIAQQATIVTSTRHDANSFQDLYPEAVTRYIPPLVPVPEVSSNPGTGVYCLYYGDMSDPENGKMAHWLSENVFSKIPVPLIVADTCSSVKEPDPAHPESNICMVSNPDEASLRELIEKAQVIILPRCHQYGFDKRLLTALERGRHCVCNDLMVMNTGIEKCFVIASDCAEMRSTILQHFSKPFTQYDINERVHFLSTGPFSQDASHAGFADLMNELYATD